MTNVHNLKRSYKLKLLTLSNNTITQAEMLYRRALSADEACAEARRCLTRILLSEGKLEEAERYVEAIPEVLHGHWESNLLRATVCLHKVHSS